MRDKRHISEIVVRRLHTGEQKEICDHFQRLDIESRRARFLGTISDVGILDYSCNIFRYDSILCGAFVEEKLRGIVELRGVSHFWSVTAEAAFSVESDWQNIGIGDALFNHMITLARNRNVRKIHLVCLKENSRMKHLAAKHDARLHMDQDAMEAVIYPFLPTLLSLAKEIIGETQGYTRIFR